MQETFTNIYNTGCWFNGSGSGSHPRNTAIYRDFLSLYMKLHSIHRVVDIGCGDWQFFRLMDWSGVEYLGVDVVDSVVAQNNRCFSSEHVRFELQDVLTWTIPPTDLVLVKDVLQHWPNELIRQFIGHLLMVPRVLITDTYVSDVSSIHAPHEHTDRSLNADIALGGMRPVDLARHPFDMPVTEMLRYPSTRMRSGLIEEKRVVELVQTKSAQAGAA